jgi:hypothetical protein
MSKPLPILEPWMISLLQTLLSKEYQDRMAKIGMSKIKSYEKMLEVQKAMRENRFTSLGQVWNIITRLDEISLAYVKEIENAATSEDDASYLKEIKTL